MWLQGAVKGTVQGHMQGFLRVFSPEIAILMLSKLSYLLDVLLKNFLIKS